MICPSGKRQHRSQAAARRFARQLGSRDPRRGKAGFNQTRHAYVCRDCGLWHLSRSALRRAA